MNFHEYIIVGAGPAGLQMGYCMEQAGRDYLILEANQSAGSFFAKFPRHRTLISINKCHNWFSEPEFNMRHDWNSLLTQDYSMRFSDYSEELYPHADSMKRYLEDFAAKFALQIQYNTKVVSVARDTAAPHDFILTDSQGTEYRCATLLMATGPVQPDIPNVEGIELISSYEDHDIDPKLYRNKRVAILGRGNSAFEVANHLSAHAAIIYILLGDKLVKHAWQTHYVGDLRAINNTILDMYELKSMHGTIGLDVTKIVRQDDGVFRVFYDEHVPHWATPGTLHGSILFDHVIRCTGWKYMNRNLFSPEITPAVDEHSKYPVLSSTWESSVPGLYFIGTVMGGRDHKAASGFIHGFRYNVRTLFNILEHQRHQKPLPSRTFDLNTVEDLYTFVDFLIDRISTTAALFQLFGVLTDVLVFSPGKVELFFELPLDYVRENHAQFGKDLVTMTLEFGFDRYSPETDALNFVHPNDPGDGGCAAFLHPVLRHYEDGMCKAEGIVRGSLVIRYDEASDEFSGEFRHHKPKNTILNFINDVTKVSPERFSELWFYNNDDRGGFTPWPPEKTMDATGLPRCLLTHNPDRAIAAEQYR